MDHFLHWAGHFHVVVVHFPIAFLIGAAVAEAISIWGKRPVFIPIVRFCLLLGTAGAIAAAVLGWIEANREFQGDPSLTLTLHRWIGTSAALWAIMAAILSEHESRHGKRSRLFRVLLFTGALLVGLAGHFGGMLVHGTHFLDW